MAISNFNYAHSIFKEMDEKKQEFYDNDVIFDFTLMNKRTGEYVHTGIGTGADLTTLNCINLVDLWAKAGKGSFTKFADSIPQVLKMFFVHEVGSAVKELKEQRKTN